MQPAGGVWAMEDPGGAADCHTYTRSPLRLDSCRWEGAPLTPARFTVTPAAADTEMAAGCTWPQM